MVEVGALSKGYGGWGVKLSTHRRLLLMSRSRGIFTTRPQGPAGNQSNRELVEILCWISLYFCPSVFLSRDLDTWS
jgi:hypothetical protein